MPWGSGTLNCDMDMEDTGGGAEGRVKVDSERSVLVMALDRDAAADGSSNVVY